MAEGKYRQSMRETKEVLRLYPRTLGDEALFQMGLIDACPKNPDHDYRRSLKRFQRVINEFPRSKVKNQAEVWVLFIREIDELKQKNSHLGKALKKEKENVEKLKDQLLRLKEVDLGIEEKKR